jgi:Putative peptidoglycan binding domain
MNCVALTVFLSLLITPAYAQTRQWKTIGTATNDDIISVDVNSIKGVGFTRTVWSKKEVLGTYNRIFLDSLTQLQINCKAETVGIIRHVEYNPEGFVLSSYNSPLGNEPISTVMPFPESVGEAVMQFVCSFIRNTESSPALTSASVLPKLELESSGPAVLQLQIRLKKLGFFSEQTTGDITKEAVMNFQRSRELNPDGIVGQKTWMELLK